MQVWQRIIFPGDRTNILNGLTCVDIHMPKSVIYISIYTKNKVTVYNNHSYSYSTELPLVESSLGDIPLPVDQVDPSEAIGDLLDRLSSSHPPPVRDTKTSHLITYQDAIR